MKKRNRMLAILLAFTMVLTFMPLLTFAEGEETGEDQQVTEALEEAVEAEAVEEEPVVEAAEAETVEEAVDAAALDAEEAEVEAATTVKVVKVEVHTVEPLWGFTGNDEVENFYTKGNYIDATFSDNSTGHFEFVSDDENERYGFYDKSFKELNVWPVADRLNAGSNTATLYTDGDSYPREIGKIEVTGKATERYISAEYKQAKPIQAEYKNNWVEFDPDGNYASFVGDVVTVQCYEFVDNYKFDEGTGEEVFAGTTKEGPYTYEYKCQTDEFGDFAFIRKYKDQNGDDEVDYLNVRFWDDQYWNNDTKSGNWLPGETHKLTATVEGLEIKGDIIVKVKEAAAHKHVLKKFKKIKATCQHTGVKEHYECTVCGEMFKDKAGKKKTTVEALTIKKTAHKFKNKKVATDEYLKTPATCTKKGVYYYCSECKVCHEQTKAKKTYQGGALKPHEFTKIDKVEATCEHTGMKEHYKCSVCNKLYASQTAKKATTAKKLTIKKLKHKFTAKTVEDKYKAKKAGMYYYSCSMCGAKGKKTFKAELPTE